jgi:hypothetical protein
MGGRTGGLEFERRLPGGLNMAGRRTGDGSGGFEVLAVKKAGNTPFWRSCGFWHGAFWSNPALSCLVPVGVIFWAIMSGCMSDERVCAMAEAAG